MAPDHVVEDLANVLRLIERGEHRADRIRADLVTALDEVDELVDDGARGRDALVVAPEREPVAAERDRAAEPLAERVEDAVFTPASSAATSLGDVEHLCTRLSVGTSPAAKAGPDVLRAPRPRAPRANRRADPPR